MHNIEKNKISGTKCIKPDVANISFYQFITKIVEWKVVQIISSLDLSFIKAFTFNCK